MLFRQIFILGETESDFRLLSLIASSLSAFVLFECLCSYFTRSMTAVVQCCHMLTEKHSCEVKDLVRSSEKFNK